MLQALDRCNRRRACRYTKNDAEVVEETRRGTGNEAHLSGNFSTNKTRSRSAISSFASWFPTSSFFCRCARFRKSSLVGDIVARFLFIPSSENCRERNWYRAQVEDERRKETRVLNELLHREDVALLRRPGVFDRGGLRTPAHESDKVQESFWFISAVLIARKRISKEEMAG